MISPKISFRDRPLKPGETSHYICNECSQELNVDSASIHKCNPLVIR